MKPNITVLGNGSSATEHTQDLLSTLSKNLPQMLTVFNTLGVSPPSWLVQKQQE